MGPRDHLLAIYGAAVDAVSGRIAVAEFLRHKPPTPSAIIAVGKAAPHMLAGAYDALAGCDFDALVITKYGYDEDLYPPDAAVTRIESAHPVPDESSLAAGAQLLTFVRQQAPGTHLLMLYSGGASSLVEVLPEGMDAEALARLNRWLLASGLSIGPMNRIRKRVSCIKAGRLAAHVQGSMTNLLISDVPGDDPKVVGSGPLARHQQEDIQVDDLDLPGWLQEMTDKAPPLAPSAAFEQISTHVIAHPLLAAETAVEAASKRGYAVHLHEELLEGDALELGKTLAQTVMNGPCGVHVWYGESTIQLPPNPGRGGRCQSMALATAQEIEGRSDVWFLAAGTDGTDGPGEDAGALVDGETLARGSLDGLDANSCLQAADAGRFLEASGDLINTGPTGTNVMDLMIGLKLDRSIREE